MDLGVMASREMKLPLDYLVWGYCIYVTNWALDIPRVTVNKH